MKSLLKTLSLAALLVVISSQAGAAEYGTFESFYSAGGLGFWGWTGIILGSIAVGALTFFTFGGGAAAAPAWMAAVGTWIGSSVGLSGIAAANFGLALLGGGTIAAGGLGVAGGVTVLATALAFSTDAVASYSIDAALEKYTHSKFVAANKNMLTLPIPRNTKGGKAYKAVMKHLKSEFKSDQALSSGDNQQVLLRAIEILTDNMSAEKDKDYQLKDKTLLALLYLQTNNYAEARNAAWNAISIGTEENEKHTMASFIYALAQLADPEQKCSAETLHKLQTAYLQESDNKLIPIMTGSCLDRMMYQYRSGNLETARLDDFCQLITNNKIDKKLSAQSLEIFITRSMILLKDTQQLIRTVARDESMLKQEKIRRELKVRLERHKKLIGLLNDTASPQVTRLAGKFPEESKIKPDGFETLLAQYRNEVDELEVLINN
ncbi:MAG: hypothetical protein IKB99_02940 [Lentisphaeria bacterium]|nr:hypothetical protein [Lentisphaeria bacterium]